MVVFQSKDGLEVVYFVVITSTELAVEVVVLAVVPEVVGATSGTSGCFVVLLVMA